MKGSSWGNHPKEQLMLYTLVIRPKIEYGAFMYLWTNTGNIAVLQKVQNQALRQALGAVITTPIVSLHAIAGMLPLIYRITVYNRRQLLRLTVTSPTTRDKITTVATVLNNISNASYKTVKDDLSYIQTQVCCHNILLPTTSQIHWRNTVPGLKDMCSTTIPKVKKKNCAESDQAIRQKVLEHLYRTYPSRARIYTDGSKRPGGVSAAYICESHGQGRGVKLHHASSIFSAETFALEMALQHIDTQHTDDCVILSDSRSALEVLAGVRIGDLPPLPLYRHLTLMKRIVKNTHLNLQWIPSHKGIIGNNLVDDMCAAIIRNSTTDEEAYTMHTDLHNNILTNQQLRWRVDYQNREGPGSWTRKLVADPNTPPWFNEETDMKISDITYINRLLMGHGFENLFKCRMKKRQDPYCEECGGEIVQDVLHLIMHCTKTARAVAEVIGGNWLEETERREELTVQFLQRGLLEHTLLKNLHKGMTDARVKV
ncbi:hypothetical protein GE061_012392 [Apolygus lucorum]|uniref:RNase H type-1 domain-containing protein n=1 Tax=Apolygus lucorum TaxID=248454 RepID=A0A8S9XUW3_APOLU|nr:hypothetical protein GE061_012392 [Apolygus lucorum]